MIYVKCKFLFLYIEVLPNSCRSTFVFSLNVVEFKEEKYNTTYFKIVLIVGFVSPVNGGLIQLFVRWTPRPLS